ncbi:MAG: carbohydrate-binding protein [Planctomycetes bacterium]|jgi:hypothetical protein|nr:carbohydrate-binding protein [Planctomycetota bacterium]
MDPRSRPDGFGTGGVAGPVMNLRGLGGNLGVAASGSWCRFGLSGCSGPAGDVATTGSGPLPNQAYNLLGGEWRGGVADGTRFAIGGGTNILIPQGTKGVQLFFNDDIDNYDDNTGSISVDWVAAVIADVGPPSPRNPDGEWGVPQFTLTIAAPPLGLGTYLVDIQASYPAVDWNTLDRLYLEGGEYKFIRIGNLPVRSPDRPLIITNINGRVRVGGQDHYYLFSLSGGSNWIVTGKYDPISLTGDAAFPGHRGNDYTNTRGTYGILVDDDFRSFGTGNSGIGVGSQVPVGIVNPPTSDYELSFIEIREVGFAGMALKTDDDGTVPMNNVYIHDNYIHDIGSEGLYIGSTQTAPQHSFNNLHIENNRILRTGTEAVQVGQLGDGCEINNNVFALAAIDWKDSFQAFQDSCNQIGVRYGRSSIHHNVFIGSANSLISFFGQERGDVHVAGDSMTIRNNFYSSYRFLGGFMGGDADGVSAYRIKRNVFRQFDFQRDEIYAGTTHPGHLIRVNGAQTNPIELLDNVFDEPSLELVNGLGGALNGTVGNITATGNSRGTVNPVTFNDFMGLPADVDYLLIERWSATSSRAGGAPTIYNLGDYVMHEGNLYLCIEAGAHSGKEPAIFPSTWQPLALPGDDVRLAPGSAHAGVGLLDTVP